MNDAIKFLLLLLLLALSNQTSAQQTTADPKSLKQIFRDAERQFSAYEKKHGHFLKTKNVNMHYLSWGNPAHPPLIWIHGSMTSAYEFYEIAEKLAKSDFYIVAIDYYGHGQTPIPAHDVSVYHVADDIKSLMNHLSIPKAFIGGFSRGGYMATAFYDAYPENVLGIVLEDGGSVAANTYHHKMSEQQLEAKAKLFNNEVEKPWDRLYDTKFDAFESLYDKNDSTNQFSILTLIKKNNSGKWGIIYSEMMKLFHLENSKQFLDLSLRPTRVPLFARSMITLEPEIIYRNLHVPLLILDAVSAQDPMPFEKENLQLKNAHPQLITYIQYLETEHNIHYDHPQKFLEDLTLFFKRSLNTNKVTVK